MSAFFILAAKLNGHKPKVQWLEALHRRATKIAEKTQSFIRDPADELPDPQFWTFWKFYIYTQTTLEVVCV